MRKTLLFTLLCSTLSLLSCGAPNAEIRESITIYAAASLTDVVGELAARFEENTGIAVATNLASSGMLAQQIIAGAPADVFLSANTDWMSEVVKAGNSRAEDVVVFAGNGLVVVIRSDAALDLDNLDDLLSPDFYKIAIADPSHSPAGKYAVEALRSAGIYDQLKDKLIPAIEVRAALAYVTSRETEAALVYRTDARIVEGIRIALEVPEVLHAPIIYQAAAIGDPAGAAGRQFLEFITSAEGRAILGEYGFTTPSR